MLSGVEGTSFTAEDPDLIGTLRVNPKADMPRVFTGRLADFVETAGIEPGLRTGCMSVPR